MLRSLNQSVDLLKDFKLRSSREVDLSLGRVMEVLQRLGSPQNHVPPVIHVAGTNGKGSTIAFLRAMLEQAGYRVHVYTSPHLVKFNERIRLNGQLISDEALQNHLAKVSECAPDIALTFFEATTIAAFLAFADHPADILLLETGMGGRLDATNVIASPLVSVITPISLDHQEYLGNTITAIAKEKAGIIKENTPAVLGCQGRAVTKLFQQQAKKKSAQLVLLEENSEIEDELCRHELSLRGIHQYDNASLAWLTLDVIQEQFPVSSTARILGLKSAIWHCRLQKLDQGRLTETLPSEAELWLDGAHNEAGFLTLIPTIKSWKEQGRSVVLGVAMLHNRDCSRLLSSLKPLVDHWFLIIMPDNERFHSAESYGLDFDQIVGMGEISKIFTTYSNGSRILITGSLYLGGEVLKANGTYPQ
jgi:dihydrofolate synthase / folylpolyglutamate synthase